MGAGGGKVGHRWKNMYQEENRLIAAFRTGDLDEPLLQRNPSVTRRVYSFWRCDIFPWVQSKTWLNCCGGFLARRTWKLVTSHFFFLYGTAKKSTSFITHVLRYFLLISSFVPLRLRSTFWKSLVKIKNSGPSLIVRYELLVVCAWQKIETLEIELLQNFFFKTLMSAVWENTNVIQMLNVEITLDPTAANVKKDFLEMAKRAQVSVDNYPSVIRNAKRSIYESFSSTSACFCMCHHFIVWMTGRA